MTAFFSLTVVARVGAADEWDGRSVGGGRELGVDALGGRAGDGRELGDLVAGLGQVKGQEVQAELADVTGQLAHLVCVEDKDEDKNEMVPSGGSVKSSLSSLKPRDKGKLSLFLKTKG